MASVKLTSPFPYFGSKRAAAPMIWAALGADVPNFVDACCGSASVLWARPAPGKVETLNDAFGQVVNFYRAVRRKPEEVAEHASWPVSELDMHARHRWLVEKVDEAFVERLRREPTFCDPEIAGWWVWGQSIWIGAGWCSGSESTQRKLPDIGGVNTDGPPRASRRGVMRESLSTSLKGQLRVGYGRGVFRSTRGDLIDYFHQLSARLQRVRITCGDWKRVCTPAVTTSHGMTGVLLDPPYGTEAKRMKKLYAVDDADTSDEMRAWCAKKGSDPHLRIVLCGYEGEHEELLKVGWRCVPCKAGGGYGNQDGKNENAGRERLWLSPNCLRAGEQIALWDEEKTP